MSEAAAGVLAGRALRIGGGAAAALRLAEGLRYAAAPVFAAMALISGVSGGDAAHGLCLAASDASPLTGMTAMYALMSVVHAPPWLKALSARRPPSGLSPRR